MKVIVFGATGFIGSSVAQAFVRAGHITYGTSRSESSKRELVAQEVIPIICDPYSKEGLQAWGRIAETADAGEFCFVSLLPPVLRVGSLPPMSAPDG